MPMKINRWNGFSVTNAFQNKAKLTYIKLNPDLSGSRLTQGVVGGCFTRNTRIAFGHGCDHPNYVSQLDVSNKMNRQA
jgi:hypothetical protein